MDDDRTLPSARSAETEGPTPRTRSESVGVTLRVTPGGLSGSTAGETSLPGMLGPYRLVRELGRGGMGVVYLGEDLALGRQVALKILPAGLMGSADARLRFRREAEVASKLSHPNLCGVLQIGDTEGVSWLAMPYIAGRTLAEEIRDGASATGTHGEPSTVRERDGVRRAIRVVETLARALHVAHEAGIVHRDLKPSNVMVRPDGTPVILDFGLARDLAKDGVTLTGDVVGTPYAMAPEQVRGERVDRQADVWSLGVILYEMLSFHRPFEAATRDALYLKILEKEPTPLTQRVRGVPRDLATVVTTALTKERSRRYATAEALAEDLRAVLEVRPIRARAPGTVGRILRFARRRPAVFALAAALGLGIPATIGLWLSGRSASERAARALEERFEEAETALRSGDLERARRAAATARTLGAARGRVVAFERALSQASALERAEALALDPEIDQDGPAALRAIEEASVLDPAQRRLPLLAAFVHLRAGRPEDAAQVMRARMASDPDAGFELLLPLIEGRTTPGAPGDRPGTDALESRPEEPSFDAADPQALFVALWFSARGHHRDALSRLVALIEARPGDAGLLWYAAYEAGRLRELHAALAFAGRARDRVLELAPERLARYASFLREVGLVTEALRAAEAAATAAPESPVVQVHRAHALAAAGRVDEAVKALRALVVREPTFGRAWRALAAELTDSGDPEGGLEASRRAVACAPRDPDAWNNFGVAAISLRRLDEAAKALSKVLELRPDHPEACNNLGACEKDRGRLDEAERLFERALVLNPGYAEAYANLGDVYKRRNDRPRAIATLRRALALAPRMPEANFNLGVLLQAEAPAEAEQLFRTTVELVPTHADANANLAALLTDRERFDEALDHAAKACALAPKDPINRVILGGVHVGAGRIADAVAAYREAALLGPSRLEPQANLMLLLEGRDDLEGYARGLELVRLDDSFAKKAEGNLVRLRDAVEGGDSEHPLALALRLLADRKDEEADTRLQTLLAAALALPDGLPGSRDFVLKRAALLTAAEAARGVGDPETAATLRDAASALLDRVAR